MDDVFKELNNKGIYTVALDKSDDFDFNALFKRASKEDMAISVINVIAIGYNRAYLIKNRGNIWES